MIAQSVFFHRFAVEAGDGRIKPQRLVDDGAENPLALILHDGFAGEAMPPGRELPRASAPALSLGHSRNIAVSKDGICPPTGVYCSYQLPGERLRA